mmetsp:Transcript_42696/g.121750  ORF Transcript_42696/g.121750 Transcript_42696/m.121750 type:complete len:200 (+) Transcript_42696:1201-1800(+)
MRPMRRAMASAVAGWSPVTITVRAPARHSRATDSAAPGLGGSSRATKPRSSKPSIGGSSPAASNAAALPSGRSAKQSMRLPSAIRSQSLACICASSSRPTLQAPRTRSGAPLSTMVPPSSPACAVSIHFVALLNGTSWICGRAVRSRSACSDPSSRRQAARIATSVGEPLSAPEASVLAAVLSTPHAASRSRPSPGEAA